MIQAHITSKCGGREVDIRTGQEGNGWFLGGNAATNGALVRLKRHGQRERYTLTDRMRDGEKRRPE